MKIQYKLLLMVGLPVCALIVISITSFLNFKEIKDKIRIANQLHLDRATMINGDRDAYQAQRALESVLTAEGIEDFNSQKKEAEDKMQQTSDKITNSAQDVPESMQLLVDNFSSQFNDWKENNDRILSLALGTLSAKRFLSSALDQAQSNFVAMRETIDTISKKANKLLENDFLDTNRRLQLEEAVTLALNGDRDAYQAYVALLLSAHATDENVLKKQTAVFMENAGQCKERIAKATDIIGGETLELKKIFLEQFTTWDNAAKMMVNFSQSSFADNRTMAKETNQSCAYFSQMRNAIDKLTEAESARVDTNIAAMNASIDHTILLFIILAGIFIFLSLSLAILISKRISNGVNKSTSAATQIAQGDFDINLQTRGKDEIAKLCTALNSMANTLKANHDEIHQKSALAEQKAAEATTASIQAQEAMQQAELARSEGLRTAANRIENVVQKVTLSCNHLNEQSESIKNGSEIQADRITNTATAMKQMNATVLEVARNSGEAAHLGETAKENAQKGAFKVDDSLQAMTLTHKQTQELKQSMDSLGLKTEEIGNIINVIEDIADQTNLLALNAAIEAARAGEAGRGFAVVADEVRKLAEKTMNATKEVGDSIKTIQSAAELNMRSVVLALESLDNAVKLSQESGNVLGEIVAVSIQTAEQVTGIATAAEEQSATTEEISSAVTEINKVTSENMKNVHASTVSIHELSEQVNELNQLIEELKTA